MAACVHTHMHTHACMHAHTHTHAHMYTRTQHRLLSFTDWLRFPALHSRLHMICQWVRLGWRRDLCSNEPAGGIKKCDGMQQASTVCKPLLHSLPPSVPAFLPPHLNNKDNKDFQKTHTVFYKLFLHWCTWPAIT